MANNGKFLFEAGLRRVVLQAEGLPPQAFAVAVIVVAAGLEQSFRIKAMDSGVPMVIEKRSTAAVTLETVQDRSTTPETDLSALVYALACAVPLIRLRLVFLLPEGRIPHAYTGSAWRGILGHQLKRASCRFLPSTPCDGCACRQECDYSVIFETPRPPDATRMRLYPSVPHPYVLSVAPDQRMRAIAGSRLCPDDVPGTQKLELSLVGSTAARRAPALVEALRAGALQGVGDPDLPMRLDSVAQETVPGDGDWQRVFSKVAGWNLQPPAAVPAGNAAYTGLTLGFPVPLRLKGDSGLVKPDRFSFIDFMSKLVRRVSMLAYFHGRGVVQGDYRALMQRASEVELVETSLKWCEWRRKSNRQKRVIPMGGLVGEIKLAADDALFFWPLLSVGRWLHVGAGTAMGLGRYTFGPALTDARSQSAQRPCAGLTVVKSELEERP